MTKRKEAGVWFMEWFEAQHGKRPSKKSVFELQCIYVDAKKAFEKSEMQLREAREWDNKRNDCLQAVWAAQDLRDVRKP